MSKERVKNDVQSVINRLNRIELRHGGCDCHNGDNMWKTNTSIRSIEEHDRGGYYINLYNDNLKIGGEDDDDENDSTLEDSLFSQFRKEMSEMNKDIIVEEIYGQEKGYFSVIIKLKSEKQKDEILLSLNKKVSDLKNKIDEFNKSIALKISNQTSKKKTCSHCDSNVNISFIKNDYGQRSHLCPVCKKPMYTDTEIKKINAIKEKIAVLELEMKSLVS